jgi:hypothetical protein
MIPVSLVKYGLEGIFDRIDLMTRGLQTASRSLASFG